MNLKVKRYTKYLFVRVMRIAPILFCISMLVHSTETLIALVSNDYVYDLVNYYKTLNTPISTFIANNMIEVDLWGYILWVVVAYAIELCWRYRLMLGYFMVELAYRHFFGDYVFGVDSIMPYVLIVGRIVICSSLLFMIIKFWINGRATSVKGDS